MQAGTSPASYNATVTVSEKAIGQIGREYIGLSFESSTINNGDRYDARGNLVTLLKTLGTSVLRFGGHSADLAAFTGLEALGTERPAPADQGVRLVGGLHREPGRVQRGAGERGRQARSRRPRQQAARLRVR